MESVNEFLHSPGGLLLAGGLAFVVGSLLFSVKQWEAHWKQWAIDTSKAMSKVGLIHTPRILDSLAVGDLAGAFQQIKGLADIFKDPQQLSAEFQTVFQNLLQAAFKDPAQARALQQLANDAVAAFASGDPAQAVGQLTQDARAVVRENPLLGSLAQHGLALPELVPSAQAGLVAQLASVLGHGGLGHAALAQAGLGLPGLAAWLPRIVPGAVTGLQTLSPAAAPVTSATTGDAPASLPAVPAGHTVTIAGPAAPAGTQPPV